MLCKQYTEIGIPVRYYHIFVIYKKIRNRLSGGTRPELHNFRFVHVCFHVPTSNVPTSPSRYLIVAVYHKANRTGELCHLHIIICLFSSHQYPPTSSSLITGMRSLMYRVKSVGAKLSPCRTPLSTENESVMTLLMRTLERRSLYIYLMVKYILPRIPLHSSLYMRSVWFTLSNALAQSTKQANVDCPAEMRLFRIVVRKYR